MTKNITDELFRRHDAGRERWAHLALTLCVVELQKQNDDLMARLEKAEAKIDALDRKVIAPALKELEDGFDSPH